jgi:hypothetical protein
MRAMSKRLRTLTITLSVVASMLAGAWSPAVAGGISRSDGNDVPGPLDLASMRLTPISGGDRIQIRTLGKFTATQLDGDAGWFEVDFDTNADRKYDFWAVVFYAKGKLFAIQGQGQNSLRKLPVRRVDTRTISFDIAHRNLGNISSYDFVVYSIWRAKPCSNANACVDTIPNRYPLIRHDFTAPSISWSSVPKYSTDVSDSLTFPVAFGVKDDRYGSGVKGWTLQRRALGTTTWTDVKNGTTSHPSVNITGDEGVTYQFRVLALDRQGNRSGSPIKTTAMPWDDRNAAMLTYSDPPTQVDGVVGAFLGTTSHMADTTTVSTTVPDNVDLCVLGGPTAPGTSATATLFVGTQVWATMTETEDTAPREPVGCLHGFTTGGQALIVTVTSSTPFVFDGLGIVGTT